MPPARLPDEFVKGVLDTDGSASRSRRQCLNCSRRAVPLAIAVSPAATRLVHAVCVWFAVCSGTPGVGHCRKVAVPVVGLICSFRSQEPYGHPVAEAFDRAQQAAKCTGKVQISRDIQLLRKSGRGAYSKTCQKIYKNKSIFGRAPKQARNKK